MSWRTPESALWHALHAPFSPTLSSRLDPSSNSASGPFHRVNLLYSFRPQHCPCCRFHNDCAESSAQLNCLVLCVSGSNPPDIRDTHQLDENISLSAPTQTVYVEAGAFGSGGFQAGVVDPGSRMTGQGKQRVRRRRDNARKARGKDDDDEK